RLWVLNWFRHCDCSVAIHAGSGLGPARRQIEENPLKNSCDYRPGETMCRARHLIFIIATASTLANAGESRAQGREGDPSISLVKPMVSAATVDDQARTITLRGDGFGASAPRVSLGGAPL